MFTFLYLNNRFGTNDWKENCATHALSCAALSTKKNFPKILQIFRKITRIKKKSAPELNFFSTIIVKFSERLIGFFLENERKISRLWENLHTWQQSEIGSAQSTDFSYLLDVFLNLSYPIESQSYQTIFVREKKKRDGSLFFSFSYFINSSTFSIHLLSESVNKISRSSWSTSGIKFKKKSEMNWMK